MTHDGPASRNRSSVERNDYKLFSRHASGPRRDSILTPQPVLRRSKGDRFYAFARCGFFSLSGARFALCRRIRPFESRAFAAILTEWFSAARPEKTFLFAMKIAMAFVRRRDMIPFRRRPIMRIGSSSTIGLKRFRSPPPRSTCWKHFSATFSTPFFDLATEFQ
jgi:hypothetical protein